MTCTALRALAAVAVLSALGCVAARPFFGAEGFVYAKGVGKRDFRTVASIVVEASVQALKEADVDVAQVRKDKYGGTIKAVFRHGVPIVIDGRAQGTASEAAVKIGKKGDRERTETFLTSIQKILARPEQPGENGAEAAAANVQDGGAEPAPEPAPAKTPTATRAVDRRGPADPPKDP